MKIGVNDFFDFDIEGVRSAEDMHQVGLRYHGGLNGYTKNLYIALQCYREAYSFGILKSASNIVNIYNEQKDYENAHKWANISEANGCTTCKECKKYDKKSRRCPKSQDFLGGFYEKGLGVEKDIKKAIEWYIKAHKQGYVNSTRRLGILYYQGIEVKKDYKKALSYFNKAAKLECGISVFYLANMYHKGLGTKKDLYYCLELLYYAAGYGHEESGQILEQFKAGNIDLLHQSPLYKEGDLEFLAVHPNPFR